MPFTVSGRSQHGMLARPRAAGPTGACMGLIAAVNPAE
ncbi:hypothetical protein SF83666_c28600 [Sinorhizobium fredii CCBAU 83666]|nr:hypothetical protein SF83666_c28600 [Sinorhizobium fredii CCBAU 83666]